MVSKPAKALGGGVCGAPQAAALTWRETKADFVRMLTLVNKSPSDELILAAARAVLRRDGPEGVTMRAVAAQAGLSATAIYRHFAHKDALLKRVIKEEYDVFLTYVGSAATGRRAGDRLRATCDRYLDFALEHPRAYQLLFVSPHGISIDRYPSDFKSGRSRGFGALRALVAECMAEGTVRDGDATDVALDLYAHMHGVVMLHQAGRFGGKQGVMRTFFRRSLARVL